MSTVCGGIAGASPVIEVEGTHDSDLQEGAAGEGTPMGAQEGDALGI